MKLREIAEGTGCLDAALLSHTFREHYGLSPREYRASARLYRGGPLPGLESGE